VTAPEKDWQTEYLEALWADAEIQARKEMRVREGAAMTSDQEDQFHDRCSTLVDTWQAQDIQDRRLQRMRATQHQDVIDGLSSIKQAVDRSAVTANTLEFAQRHPFLAGVFGRMLFDKIRG
jgi:uncharacterized protein YicC (UPF0701 family)